MAFASDLGKRKGRCVGVKTWQKLGPGRTARWGSRLCPVSHSSVTWFMARHRAEQPSWRWQGH